MSGRGAVFSFVVFRRSYHPAFRDAVPYAVAVIALAEGPRFLSRLVDVGVEVVRVGMPVGVSFVDVAGTKLPLFRPAAGAASGEGDGATSAHSGRGT